MNLIIPSIEIWQQGDTIQDMWSHIARCTRVCYQSQKKNEAESDENFVKRVILAHKPYNSEANHLAMLEHGTVYLRIPIYDAKVDFAYQRYFYNKYSKAKQCIEEEGYATKDKDYIYVTTNLRVLVENEWFDDLQYICSPTEHHAKRVTVSFITNIGVTREFNRHRVDSPSEESTRNCNYNKKNNGELNIGLPAWLLDEEHLPYLESHKFDELSTYCEEYLNDNNDINPECWCDMDFYLFALSVSEYCYNMLIKKGWKPQQAREVLPLATKSQLIHTAFVDDWKHFFKLRADGVSGAPHPNAKLVAKPLKEKFIELGYIKG